MDMELVKKIKRIAIIALASDDELVETLVLKGGNAIDLTYNANDENISRTSYDLDYSIENGDFNDSIDISRRIEATLRQTFLEHEFLVLDYKFMQRPQNDNLDTSDFWGGYKVEFKVNHVKYENQNLEKIRRSAIPLNPNNSPVFELEFSKFEYLGIKKSVHVDGYKIYIYTPEMIVFEKLRALCQQVPEYRTIVPSFTPRARARDFYDIHLIMSLCYIDLTDNDHIRLIKDIFSAKKVPLDFIKKIRAYKAMHSDDWQSVMATTSQQEDLYDFNYYFDFVMEQFENIIFP